MKTKYSYWVGYEGRMEGSNQLHRGQQFCMSATQAIARAYLKALSGYCASAGRINQATRETEILWTTLKRSN